MKKIYITGLGFINPLRMSTGNKKIVDTLIFNMPAGKNGTCGQTCQGCYALKASRLYPNVKVQREHNKYLFDNHKDTLLTLLLTQLHYSDLQVVRVHESGDFFSQEYLNFWIDIASLLPDKLFYAYTKTVNLFGNVPDNFNIINSWIDGKPNYGTIEQCKEWSKQGYLICPATQSKNIRCNKDCFHCHYQTKVCFVKH